MPDPAEYASWTAALADLHAYARAARDPDSTADDATTAIWTPPIHLGPLPVELRERAESLLAEQRVSARTLDELHRVTGRHLSAVRAVPQLADRQSVYLDVTG
ncbi:hypothetical protein GCM10027413_00460 [Conyzicola nivalis]|uniref:Uncharacterized protein n=1 Tax=Conyzicola nivalis TaxID=1477021 RepID=A0A916SRQ8_9MICO|nr:hypothetical protein [Conyzicola nivalis]GGB10334.1 hypothetical protein GCM10010979_26180 [Conyzicola nivalis]